MSFEDSYGELANRLVLQSKQSMNLGKLLPYDDTLVRQVIQEQKELDKKLRVMESNGVEMGDPKWPVVVISARVMHQSKRCLLAYHSQRLDIIRAAYWEAGGAAGHVLGQLQQNMSQSEIQYLRDYRDSVVTFRNDIFPDDVVDLALGMTDPPKQLTITVETIVSPGPIHTQSGIIDFQHGQRYILLKSDVEHLILQGYLKEVGTN
jgi:GINS complex subunit 1